MSKNSRINNSQEDNFKNKILISSGVALAVLAAIVISFVMYGNELNNNVKESKLSSEQIASLMSNETQNTIIAESASSTIGKSIEETERQENSTTNEINNTIKKITKKETKNNKITNTTQNKVKNETATTSVEEKVEEKKEDVKKELSFEKPVEGEIVKEFAKENLIYSETLKEWVTHNGIDIKADKTTVVKAAEEGTVKTIKNDPRYGLTVVIEHADNMKTVYSNLLTAEFVVEGEKVTKGQTIGTVGNTAVFEISDEPHLHFEIWKDQIAVDPTIYIK